jgi:hypothetical protein
VTYFLLKESDSSVRTDPPCQLSWRCQLLQLASIQECTAAESQVEKSDMQIAINGWLKLSFCKFDWLAGMGD